MLHYRLCIDEKSFLQQTWPSLINNYLFADNAVVAFVNKAVETVCFCSKLVEVNEEFIQQYNLAEAFEEKERFEDVARTMLERIKVCGIGEGNTVRRFRGINRTWFVA